MTITYALGPLISTPFIHAIYIVAAEEYREDITSDAGKLYKEAADKIKGFADPGVNRQGSILSGMEKILDDMGSSAFNIMVQPSLTALSMISLIYSGWALRVMESLNRFVHTM